MSSIRKRSGDNLQVLIKDARLSGQLALDQLRSGNLETRELLFVNTSYLGGFGVLALLMPSMATLLYGGDGSPYYANDWVKCSAVSNIFMAVISAFCANWERRNRDARCRMDVLKAFFVFYAVASLNNLYTVLYGSLRFVTFVNVIVDAALAFFHFQRSDFMKPAVASDTKVK